MRIVVWAVLVLLGVACVWALWPEPTEAVHGTAGWREAAQERAVAQADQVVTGEQPASRETGAVLVPEMPLQVQHQGVAPPKPVAGTAQLEVVVREAQSGVPLADVGVAMYQGMEARIGRDDGDLHCRRTDQEGLVRFEVSTLESVHVMAGGVDPDAEYPMGRSFWGEDDPHDDWGREQTRLEPLEPGEVARVELALSPRLRAVHFRVVDGETGAAIAGARAVAGASERARSDEDGLLEVPIHRRSTWGDLLIDHEDYGPAVVQPGGWTHVASESAETARRVELFAPASVELSLTRGGLPLEDVTVFLDRANFQGEPLSQAHPALGSTPAEHEQDAVTGPTGEVRFEDLGAGLRYAVWVRVDGRDQLLPDGVELQAGERGRLNWELGAARSLRGRVLDDAGSPVRDAAVWLMSGSVAAFFESEVAALEDYLAKDARIATQRTGADGVFVFEDLTPGTYAVMPAPEEGSEHVALARRVEVPPDREPPLVDLLLARGAMVLGRVLDPEGAPVAGFEVYGFTSGSRGSAESETDAQGSFRMGPFAAGSTVYLSGSDQRWKLADETQVVAGANDEVVLRVYPPARLSGHVVNPAGERVPARIIVSRPDGHLVATGTGENGGFVLDRLSPGSWCVVALADGAVGRTGFVTVTPGGRVDDLVVEVRPAARVAVRAPAGEVSYAFRLAADDAVLVFDWVEPGARKVNLVPPGPVKVTASRSGSQEVVYETTVQATKDGVVEVVIDPDD